MIPEVQIETDNPDLVAGIAVAEGVTVAEAPQKLAQGIDLLVARRAAEPFPPEELRKGVRDLLRFGGYKPTGRGKPASEYLAKTAAGGEFPRINNLVDTCNFYSLLTGFPISLLDLDRALGDASALVLREGRPEERFAFNASGHEISVKGLLGVARAQGPALGNPVKDSVETKTHPQTRSVIAVIWGTRKVAPGEVIERMAEQLGKLLEEHGGADSVETWAAPRPDGGWDESLADE